MSIKRLSGAGLTTPKSNKLWDQTTFQSGMFALATVTLTSTAASVTFANIPQTYTHLQLRCLTQGNRATYGLDGFDIVFNSDSTNTNYAYHSILGDGTTAQVGGSPSADTLIHIWDDTGTVVGGSFGAAIIDILDYKSTTKAKTVKTFGGVDFNGVIAGYGGRVVLSSGLWKKNTASVYEAVSTINLNMSIGTLFSANSHFALYGIKAG